jgi:basic membrane protein A
VHVYGLEVDGVGYALDEHNEGLLSEEVLARVESIKEDIIAGRIKVTDYTATH